MRQLTRTLLTLFAAVLALWLVVGFWPLSTVSRSVLSICILLVCGAALWHRWRRRQFVIPVTEHVLPPEDFQGAVVLACGDTTSLFPPDTVYRETRQGWYIHAQNAEQLPLLAQHLAAVRPALVSQVSVLLALIPEQQTSEEALAQTLRGWRRSITQCRNWLNGVPPVWSVAWVSPPDLHSKEEAQWFTVTPELPGVRVRQNGHVALPVTDWQWESGSRASRLYDTLWLDSILALMAHHLTRPLSARQGELPQLNLCAAGICLTPIAATEDNLWQQQITARCFFRFQLHFCRLLRLKYFAVTSYRKRVRNTCP
ncbi:TPA: hypothetical protein MX419_003777 [Enterobacter hormaechei]|nr:hypothetical protein [Enterobacter hormaechei]HCM9419288.1 hypothetical protein [Enterobacter hormaechei subsp. xiangfangensis]